jgi:hypothetical protein
VTGTSTRDALFRRLVFAAVGCGVAYPVSYGVARWAHRLVRYESGCVARGGLEGRGRDYWDWPFRCDELRAYLDPDYWKGAGWERAFALPVALEEAARDPQRQRLSVCSLPPPTSSLPSQGLTRPGFCGPSSLPPTPATYSAALPPAPSTGPRDLEDDGTDPKRASLPEEDWGFFDPHRGEEWGKRCLKHIHLVKWGWAKAECDEAMKLDPASPQPRASILYYQGLIDRRSGDNERARQDLLSSLALEESAEARAVLSLLQPGPPPANDVPPGGCIVDNVIYDESGQVYACGYGGGNWCSAALPLPGGCRGPRTPPKYPPPDAPCPPGSMAAAEAGFCSRACWTRGYGGRCCDIAGGFPTTTRTP